MGICATNCHRNKCPSCLRKNPTDINIKKRNEDWAHVYVFHETCVGKNGVIYYNYKKKYVIFEKWKKFDSLQLCSPLRHMGQVVPFWKPLI